MNTVNGDSNLKGKSYLPSNTKYGSYELDVLTNKKCFYLKINGKEYSIPRIIFRKRLGIGNNHDGISDYVFDLNLIGITNNSKIIQPNIEGLIISSLGRIAEYIQENQNKDEIIDSLLKSIKDIVDSIIGIKCNE